jgi:hypothetical protein
MIMNTYFLVFLTFWVQFDDLLLAFPSAGQAAPLPCNAEADEYLPPVPQERQERSSPRRQDKSVSARAQAADAIFVARCQPAAWNQSTPLSRPPLYVLMSLQI